jgi:ribosomal protein L29
LTQANKRIAELEAELAELRMFKETQRMKGGSNERIVQRLGE